MTEIQADDVEFLAKPGAGGSGGGGGRDAYAPHAPAESESNMFASEMNDVLVDDEELPF